MNQALALAKKAEGRTAPNPPVGAVVVSASGEVVGRGWHHAAGLPHAEPNALDDAGQAARGATIYVTLEPCNHHGRTPPCTERIIEAGIARVVVGSLDPNPKVAGGGVARLTEAGLQVRHGVNRAQCDMLLAPFARHISTGRPWVVLKMAASLDGKIATAPDRNQWLTGPAAKAWAHRLRNVSEAILVGRSTVEVDDPSLTCRLNRGRGQNPLRVVLDSRAKTSDRAKVVTGPQAGSPAGGGCLIITGPAAGESDRRRLERAGAQVEKVETGPDGRPDPGAVLDLLGHRKVMRLMIEGGPGVAASFVRAGLVDEICLLVAPLVIGGHGAPGLMAGPMLNDMDGAARLEWLPVRRLGPDLLIRALVKRTD